MADMTYVISDLCLRDGACVDVCPVDCIRPGEPQDEWPTFYIDQETCIDCGACLPECPYEAIFDNFGEEEMRHFTAIGGEKLNAKPGTPGFDEKYEGTDARGNPVKLDAVRTLKKGEEVDLTDAIEQNWRFFTDGPGYDVPDF